ncbi:GNAT family N-acetyltransferase [Paucilactobacillus kaifaensis]|uniref:GNAT family N-acetyltransferase n=1 Tax=Paucilactobacillus kaifaensis TaxID=2559921 RepID=UPI0010F688A5|nr:GNAT family N-acetyltransferase [Paucilactobacillus kaifaensis]
MLSLKMAQPSDLPFIVTTYNQTIPSHMVTADLAPVSVADRKTWFAQHDDNYPLWLLMQGDQPAGWVSLSHYNDRAAYDATVEISIYIDEHFRHQGIGTQAIKLVELEAKQRGLKVIVSRIFGHNPGSIHLFEKMGYEHWGHLPQVAVLVGQQADLEVYGKHLA